MNIFGDDAAKQKYRVSNGARDLGDFRSVFGSINEKRSGLGKTVITVKDIHPAAGSTRWRGRRRRRDSWVEYGGLGKSFGIYNIFVTFHFPDITDAAVFSVSPNRLTGTSLTLGL